MSRDKYYCDISWESKPQWLQSAYAAFLSLWAEYNPYRSPREVPRRKVPASNDIDDAIDALVNAEESLQTKTTELDEYERWKQFEPRSLKDDDNTRDPIKYWLGLRTKYPNLPRLALDVLSVPASSCDCERMFSELGDLLERKRRKISPQLLAAIQCIRSWLKAGFERPDISKTPLLADDVVDAIYGLCEWDQTTE